MATPVAPSPEALPRYGVLEQATATDEVDIHLEALRLQGFTILDVGLSPDRLDALQADFDTALTRYREHFGAKGYDLEALGENEVVRALLSWAPAFLELAFHPVLLTLMRRLLGDYFILNQSNGLINPAHGGAFSQRAYHRDLPFRHLTMSRTIAANALFTLDPFRPENGSTRVVPGSHRVAAFPSDAAVRRLEVAVEVPRGHFLILDAMTFHCGGLNTTAAARRAVNHVFTIPAFRQQLHLPSVLGERSDLTTDQRRILGYDLEEYSSHDAWFRARQARQPEQGSET